MYTPIKNILMLTPIYPGVGMTADATPVIHYFVKEWIELGYNVKVVRTLSVFPSMYYKIGKYIMTFLSKKEGIAMVREHFSIDGIYEYDGVEVLNVSMRKMIPHGSFSKTILNNSIQKITGYLKSIDFIPDVIVSHWVNPSLYLSAKLKDKFQCPAVNVLHSYSNDINVFKHSDELIKAVDIWGYRSIPCLKSFEDKYGIQLRTFRCCSGIPPIFTQTPTTRNWEKVSNVTFIGMLIARKYPDCVLGATVKSFRDAHYHLNIVGAGGLESELKSLANSYNTENNISFLGRVSRQEIVKLLDETDIFAMISREEIFGLVYLEAMARGCITIASKNEGMEGIIEDGVNGFLCEAGNENELTSIIMKIRNMTPNERSNISIKGRETASAYTDENVAKNYIDSVRKFCNELSSDLTK